MIAVHEDSRLTSSPSRPTFIALTLILLATWLRLWRLESIPPGLWFDEAYNALDSVWMMKTGTWPVFLQGNNGREAMFHYLLAPSIAVLGETTYAVRLVPVLLSILTLPLMYRFTLTLYGGKRQAPWLALVGTAGLITSFWYLTMNRAGYRANLLPLFVLFVSYFFWQGWQTGKIHHYLIAGAGLGLSQYTYLSARLLPLVFLLFVLIQTLMYRQKQPAQLKTVWRGLLVMGGVSALVASPLLLFFFNNPDAFWGRVGDVVVKVDGSLESFKFLAGHLRQALRVFLDGEDPNWRHHLLGRPGFDWVNTLGFMVGLFITLRRYTQPANLLLLLSLFIMWLPAPLSEPPLHTLRLAGVLPAYYILVAVGMLATAGWVKSRFLQKLPNWQAGMMALAAILFLSGGITFYDYFYRWGNLEEVYNAYDGPVVDLAHYLTTTTSETNLIIPFYLYTHASMRYFLHSNFKEEVLMPERTQADLSQQESVSLVIPKYPPDDGQPPAFVWLIKDGTGPGTAYVSAVRRDVSLTGLASRPVDSIKGSRNNVIAQQYRIDPQDVLSLFPQQMPRKKLAVEWADNLRLSGYQFVPETIEAGSEANLYLSWNILSYTGLKEKIFLQLLDNHGNPVGQQELEPISRKMYRWRDDELILEQYPLKLAANLNAGLYFVRLGYFDPQTGLRLQAYSPTKQPLGEELIVGPLYISADHTSPIQPQHPIKVMIGREFELLGYSIYPSEAENSTEIELYWKTHVPVDINYTVFVQLLDHQNQIIAQADGQPLPNLYPTSRWQPGDIISDRFLLPIGEEIILSEGNRLVTGMYDFATGIRLPIAGSADNSAQLSVGGI